MVKASALRAVDPGFGSQLRREFFGSSHTNDLKKLALQWLLCQAPGDIGSALRLVGLVSVYCDWVRVETLICNFYLSVAAHKNVWADPSLRYTSMLLGTFSSQQTNLASCRVNSRNCVHETRLLAPMRRTSLCTSPLPSPPPPPPLPPSAPHRPPST